MSIFYLSKLWNFFKNLKHNYNKMNILIVGGAGYIGSHVTLAALDKGCKVTVFDDLSTGFRNNVPDNVNFIHGSTLSKSDLKSVFEKGKYDSVIHLAASKAAGESMVNPLSYANNNIIGGINLIKACVEFGIKSFIFSSSAAVYGMPKYTPIDEKHLLNPENYYGYTKLCLEENLKWFSNLNQIRYASLRYFNAAGYDLKKSNLSRKKPSKFNSCSDGNFNRAKKKNRNFWS